MCHLLGTDELHQFSVCQETSLGDMMGHILTSTVMTWRSDVYHLHSCHIYIYTHTHIHIHIYIQFSHLNASITPGNYQWKGAAPLFSRREVQMIIGVYEFL